MLRRGKVTWLALILVGVNVIGLWPAAVAPQPAKRKMAMLMPGTIQDADYSMTGYVALQELAKTYDLQVSHSESVAVADAERISREYISSGYEIIAYHGAQYPTIMRKLAAQYPKVSFIQELSGRLPDTPTNAWIIGRKFYQGFYTLGALAALSTKANKIGFIAGIRLPDVITSHNAVHQAIKDYNPNAQFIYNYVGDFNDPVKARQTAESQIAAGVDFIVVFVNLGLYGIVEAVKAAPRPVLLTTIYTEKWDLAPKHLTVSLLFNFDKPYKEIVAKILRGERTGYYEMRPGSGMELSEVRNVPPEVGTKVRAIFKEVVDGKPIAEVADKIVIP